MGITAPLAGDGFNRLSRDLFDCLFWGPKMVMKNRSSCWWWWEWVLLVFSGPTDRLVRELVPPFLFCWEKGKRCHGSASSGCGGHSHRFDATGYCWGNASGCIQCHCDGSRHWLCSQLTQLLWASECHHLAVLGRSCCCGWPNCAPSGTHNIHFSHFTVNKVLSKNRVCSNDEWVTQEGAIGKTRIQSLYCEEVSPEGKFTDKNLWMWCRLCGQHLSPLSLTQFCPQSYSAVRRFPWSFL